MKKYLQIFICILFALYLILIFIANLIITDFSVVYLLQFLEQKRCPMNEQSINYFLNVFRSDDECLGWDFP